MPLSSRLYKLPLFITLHSLLSSVSSTVTLPYILKKVLLHKTRTSQDKPHMRLLDKKTKKSIGTIARIHSNQRRKLNKCIWHLWSPFLVLSRHTLSTVTPDSVYLSSNTPRHWMQEITCLTTPSIFCCRLSVESSNSNSFLHWFLIILLGLPQPTASCSSHLRKTDAHP